LLEFPKTFSQERIGGIRVGVGAIGVGVGIGISVGLGVGFFGHHFTGESNAEQLRYETLAVVLLCWNTDALSSTCS
jgi:hypothetical protein